MKNQKVYDWIISMIRFISVMALSFLAIVILWFYVIDARIDSERKDTKQLIQHMEKEMTFTKQHGMEMKNLDRTGGEIGNRKFILIADDKKEFTTDEIREGKYGWYLGKKGLVKYDRFDKRYVPYDELIRDYDNVTLKEIGVTSYFYEDLVKMMRETLLVLSAVVVGWFVIYSVYAFVALISRKLKHPSERNEMSFGKFVSNTYMVYAIGMFLMCFAYAGLSNPWVVIVPALVLVVVLNYIFVEEYGNFNKDSEARSKAKEARQKRRDELDEKKRAK